LLVLQTNLILDWFIKLNLF